jgi:hypothetical protein
MNASKQGNRAEGASTYTDAAVTWCPARTVVGRQAILEDFRRAEPFATMELFITEIEGRGDLSLVSGHSPGVVDGGGVARGGKHLDIRKRLRDLSWLVYRNGSAAMAAAFDPVSGEPGTPVRMFSKVDQGRITDRTMGP